MEHSPRGRHVMADFWGCSADKLKNLEHLEAWMGVAAAKAGMTVLDSVSHVFDDGGISMVLLLAESHLSIHTYPGYGYAAVDCYTCGKGEAITAVRYLMCFLEPLAGAKTYDHCRGVVDSFGCGSINTWTLAPDKQEETPKTEKKEEPAKPAPKKGFLARLGFKGVHQ